jgi:hypothetical protein
MGKALKAVGTAIVIVGAIAATGGAALAFGAGAGLLGSASLATSAVLSIGSFSVSAGALLTVGSLVSSVGGALSQPKVSTAGSALGWVGDPNGPMHFAVGRIAVAGDLRHKKAYGPNDRMYFSAVTVVSDAGPITEFESFTANDIPVTFDVNGKANTSYFANVMWMRRQLGNQPEASYLASPAGLEGSASLPNWGPSHKLSAKAAFVVTLSENSKGSAYKGQQPKPRHIIKGLRVYDWRQDSTYPGGAGSQRLNDPSTWTFSENPALWAAKWTYGLWEGPTGKGAPQIDYQVGGIGVTPGVIDFASLTELANIADTHGWKVAAWPSTDDDKAQVLNAFLQAAGAYYIEKSGKMACLHRAAPRVSVATVTAADTAGPIELDTSSSYVDRKNTGVPTYLSEADGWKMTALGEVSAPEWVTQDGGRQRSMPMTYSFVPQAKQAAELMCLGIANTREGISGRIPLKPYMQGIEAGSAFTITEPEFVLNGLKCLALETSYDATTGVHTVTFVSETDGKYAYAYGQSPTPPAPPALEAVDPTFVTPPLPGDWTVTVPGPAPDGSQLPNIDLTGLVSNDTADALLISWRAVASGENPNTPPLYLDPDGNVLPGWMDAGSYAPTIRSLTIQGPKSGAVVWLALRYRRGSNFSSAELKGPITVRTLVADVMPNAPGLSQIRSDIEAAFGDIFDVSALVSQARSDIDAQGTEIAAARGGQGNLSARLTQLNQFRIDGDTALGTSITNLTARTAATEADIIDLENAVATEAGARAQAIQQVTARLATRRNEVRNATGALGLQYWNGSGFTSGTSFWGPFFFTTANGNQALYSDPFAVAGSGQYTIQIDIEHQAVAGLAGANILWFNGPTALGFSSSISTALNRNFTNAAPLSLTVTAPSNATRGQLRLFVDGHSNGYIAWRRAKVELGPSATGWTDDATTDAIGASVTEQALAIIDVENQLSLASWSIKTAASGGKPTILQLLSGSFGSSIAMTAEQIYFGDNTVFDDATDTIQTIWGSTRKVMAWGAPFGPDNLVEWTGPSNISLGSMTKANAGFWVDRVGAYGPTPLPSFWAKVTPTQISRSRTGAGSISTALNDVIVTCYTGTSGATCTWSRVSGDTTINYPSTGFTPVFNTTLAAGQTKTALFVGLVAKGGDVDLVYVNVEFSDNV